MATFITHNPFPLKAYSRPSISNSRVSPRATSIVEFPVMRFTGSSRLPLSTQTISPVLPLAASSDRSSVKENNSVPCKDITAQVREWADKQPLLVGAAGYAGYLACEQFVRAFVVKTILDFLIRLESSEIEWVLSYTGDYRPFVFSFLRSPLIYARNFAVFMITYKSITYAIARLRGKYDVQTVMVGGLGEGVMISLVTGLKGHCIISLGVFLALVSGLNFQWIKSRANPDHKDVYDRLSQPQAENEDEREEGTNNLFIIIFNYWRRIDGVAIKSFLGI